MFKLFKKPVFYLLVIILISFSLRLYKIDNPVADWHSWRQADTAAVARNFYKQSFNPFVPRYDDMSGVAQNPVPNPQRYRFVEFPIYNSLVYFTYLLNGGIDERLARLVSIIISLGSLVFVYLITKRYFGTVTALLSALLFGILPFNIYFSRSILPEPILVFFSLGMLYFLDRWIFENKKPLFILGIIFTSCAFLTKPYSVFYLLPLVYSYYQKEGKFWPIPKRYFSLAIWPAAALILWRVWIAQHPEGIPASNWLLNGTGIRFKPVFFKWILGDRFGREILSVCGTLLFFLGLLIKARPKEGLFLHLFAAASLLFLIVFATGNVQHDYYQTFIVPALVIFVARGFILLFEGIPNFLPRVFTIPLALLFLIMTIYLTWGEVSGLYQINNPSIIEAGREADRILPKDAIVIAAYNGDTSFLYQTNRAGWPNVAFPIEEMIERFGVTHYISTTYDSQTKQFMENFTVLAEDQNFVIIDLTNSKKAP